MVNKKLLLGILVIVAVVAGWWLLSIFNHATVHELNFVAHTAVAKVEKISLWSLGNEKVIKDTKLANYLISILEKANTQAKCPVYMEDVERLEQEGRVLNLHSRIQLT